MSDGYMPTNQLRILQMSPEKAGPKHPGAWNGSLLIRVLQQLWVSDHEGEEPEWRDVPIVEEP